MSQLSATAVQGSGGHTALLHENQLSFIVSTLMLGVPRFEESGVASALAHFLGLLCLLWVLYVIRRDDAKVCTAHETAPAAHTAAALLRLYIFRRSMFLRCMAPRRENSRFTYGVKKRGPFSFFNQREKRRPRGRELDACCARTLMLVLAVYIRNRPQLVVFYTRLSLFQTPPLLAPRPT